MRRSTRARARGGDDTDGGANDSATGETAVLPTRETKRARKNETDAQASGAQTKSKKTSPEWVHRTLPEDKRAAWDAVFKAHFHLHKSHELLDVYELAAYLSPEKPLDAFVTTANIRLIGPFELLSRDGSTVQIAKPLHLHGRFYLDPPEVISVFADTDSTTGAHWGLFRDTPNESPTYVVFSADATICTFQPVAQSLFTVLRDRIQAKSNSSSDVDSHLKLLNHYINTKYGSTTKSEIALCSQRSKETLASSLHGLGIVVPYDAKKRSGFRELPIIGENLRELLTHIQSGDTVARKKLTNLLTRATIANDECDFGTSLLLGLDLFTAGTALQKEALQMLRVAYMLLGRKEFAKVVSDHAKHRKQDLAPLDCLSATESDMSIALP